MNIILIESKKGFIFTSDAIITTIIILFAIFVFIFLINNNLALASQFEKEKYLEEKTIFVADSFVKNFDSENSLLGACKINNERKRVLSNEINSENFSKIFSLEINDFFIEKIEFENAFQKNIIYQNKETQNFTTNNCISIKRFVLLENIKTIFYFKGCLNE